MMWLLCAAWSVGSTQTARVPAGRARPEFAQGDDPKRGRPNASQSAAPSASAYLRSVTTQPSSPPCPGPIVALSGGCRGPSCAYPIHRMSDAVVDWLLEPRDPAVRYATLTQLLGRSARSAEVRAARQAIMRSGVVAALLAQQNDDGSWGKPEAFYTAKYRGTVWQLLILAEHFADGRDARVKRACEFVLQHSQDPGSGGFAIHSAKRAPGGLPSEVIPCLTGNVVFSLLRFGYAADPRLASGVEWLTRYLRFDDGDSEPPADFPYARWEICFGRHSCFMGVVKGLKAFAEIPAAERSAAVGRTVRAGAEFMLKHHVYRCSHRLSRVAKPGWKRFGFPRMYQTDVLEVLLLLVNLGYRDPRMQDAIELVRSARGADGRFLMRDSFNGKFLVDIEQQGKPSKWVTLNALRVLKKVDELAAV